jgi:hypothetical protein
VGKEGVDRPNWHAGYDDSGSALAARLAIVQDELGKVLARRPAGPIRLLSICAGQGRDVLPVLARHPRRQDVSATLVEIDPENAAAARQRAAAAGLAAVAVVEGDAALTNSYAGHVPADVVLVCGLFGNIADADIERTVWHLPHLCAAGADVIWTRNLGPKDGSANLTPAVRGWFRDAGFAERAFRWTDGGYGIGTHHLVGLPQPYTFGYRLFSAFAQRW